jgi:AraC-like DNA-binding protein
MWCLYIVFLLFLFYSAWWIYQLHEKYMRLTIDYLQQSRQADTTSLSVNEVHELPATSPMETEEVVGTDKDETDKDETEGKVFVDKATKLILERLSDSDFNIDQLCREMAMSRTLFYVKLKSYTGKSPQDFIRIIRLERAAVLLRSGRSVTDVAALTGFDNPKYFSTVFKKYFEVSPSKYQG